MSISRTARNDASTVTDHSDEDGTDDGTTSSTFIEPDRNANGRQSQRSSLSHNHGHGHGRKRCASSQTPKPSNVSGNSQTATNTVLDSSLTTASDTSISISTSTTTSGNTLINNNIPLASVANQFALDQNRIGLHENDPRAFISLCLSYKNDGSCAFTSEQCANVHGNVCEMCGHAALHPYNELYKRKHIATCLREHEINMEHSFAIARSRDKTCGICLEVVVEKTYSNLFGVLSNCGHCFCLECIRKWRTQRNYNLSIVRSCPMCRQSSDFVCPSRFWVEDGEEKERLIADYKLKCATKACRHFRAGSGICPFGNKCFYLHALPNGDVTDVGPPPSSLPQNRRHRRRRRSRPNRFDRELAALLLLSASSAFAMTRQQGSSNPLSTTTSASLQAFVEAAAAASAASASWSSTSTPELSSTPMSLHETEENGSISSNGATVDADDGNSSSNSVSGSGSNDVNRSDDEHNRRRRRGRNVVVDDLDDDFDEIQFDFEGFRFTLRDLIFEVMNDDDMLDLAHL